MSDNTRSKLQHRVEGLSSEMDFLMEKFRNAFPFPHIIIDSFLPPELADAAFEQYPPLSDPLWTELPTDDQRRKWATTDEKQLPLLHRTILQELNSGYFLNFLERLTGIDGLIADTKLVGGGLHQIERGGRLSMHIDFSHHPQNGLYRRLNFLLYLNRDWEESYGGHLELWDEKLKQCQTKVLPAHNRAVLFATSDRSYHGHPEPLSCPATTTRKSLSLYYFTKDPSVAHGLTHNTLFRSRPGERTTWKTRMVRFASSGFVRDLFPPILYRSLRALWNRRYAGT